MDGEPNPTTKLPRRKFLQISAVTMGTLGAITAADAGEPVRSVGRKKISAVKYNGLYTGERLNRVAFPLGGLGAGMICFEGTGALSHFSLRNKPEVFNEPCVFAALAIKGKPDWARVLEGPVPGWKLFGLPGTGNGAGGTSFGLPRFSRASFQAEFPFATVILGDNHVPAQVKITGWSPFEAGAADQSSLPVAALEYQITNKSNAPWDAVFSFNARNFMAAGQNEQGIRPVQNGFVLWDTGPKERPWETGAFSATVTDPAVQVNHAWFRGGWFDALTMAWKDIRNAACYDRPPVTEHGPAPGATLFVPFRLAPGESRTLALRLAWYVGQTNLRLGKDVDSTGAAPNPPSNYRPWYANRFSGIEELTQFWRDQYDALRSQSDRFRRCFYDSTLPGEVIEAVAANLTILKSPTVLRQADGKLWAWEGCNDNSGCCHGTCTHVWNYAQAIPHLFPDLERSLRETEFGPSQESTGHQTFRSGLPIRPIVHDFYAAADGQLGGMMKVFREWRISGDTAWLRRLWPKIKQSLNYCIETWDPAHKGVVEEPHHNTYDIEFWGPDGMCTSFYLGALKAAILMGQTLGDDVARYQTLLDTGSRQAESALYNGEYFIQKIEWKNLRAKNPLETKSMVGNYSPEAVALFDKEGPKYQYGNGCLSDGVLGCWLAAVCGVGPVLDPEKVASHLRAVHRYNFKPNLSAHANPQRPSYACGDEGGLLLCTWPHGDELSLPFVYSNEVWTGIEYQVASHLTLMGRVREGLDIVRACRDRYDGRVRNPFNEYECGHWYARAMASYALLQGLTGARYDAVEKALYLAPQIRGDFRSFFAAATGYGTVGVKNGKPFFEAAAGQIDIREFKYSAKS